MSLTSFDCQRCDITILLTKSSNKFQNYELSHFFRLIRTSLVCLFISTVIYYCFFLHKQSDLLKNVLLDPVSNIITKIKVLYFCRILIPLHSPTGYFTKVSKFCKIVYALWLEARKVGFERLGKGNVFNKLFLNSLQIICKMFVCVSVVLMEFQKLAQPCKSSQDKKKSHFFFQIPDDNDFGATESLNSLKLDSSPV